MIFQEAWVTHYLSFSSYIDFQGRDLLAQSVVVLNSFHLVLQLLNPAQNVHVLLLQDPQPELVPEQSDPPQLAHQQLHLHTQGSTNNS